MTGRLARARVAFTGRLASMTRAEARRIVADAGGTAVNHVSRRLSILVVGMEGWPLLADGTVSRKLRRAEALNRGGARIRIMPEAEFLEVAGLVPPRSLHKSYPAADVRKLLGLDEATLRRWEQFGLIRAVDGRYDFQDIVSLRTVAGLVERGVAPATIARSIRGLASVLPGTDRPLSQLQILEQSGSLVAEVGDRLVAPDGQLLLGFGRARADEPPAAPVVIEAVVGAGPDADEWLQCGLAHEDEERYEDAAEAYRAALRVRPGFPEAHFNLGNALRSLGRLDGAEERYRMALDQDPSLAGAWYNLADLLEEAGRLDEAVECLGRAIETSPSFADAHFNMAHCCERLGREADASAHWSAYLGLDPDSEWGDVARRRLSGTTAAPARGRAPGPP